MQNGKLMNMYLFFRRKLKWDMTKYTNYFTAIGLLGLAAPYLIIPILTDTLRFKDTTILLVSNYHCKFFIMSMDFDKNIKD